MESDAASRFQKAKQAYHLKKRVGLNTIEDEVQFMMLELREDARVRQERVVTETKDSLLSRLHSFVAGVKRFANSEDYADLTLTCRGRVWEVHKVVLCAQSDFFHAACSKNFKEAKESKICLDDEAPEIVEIFIHYLYNFDYDDEMITQAGLDPVILDVHMFALADKYFVAPLKQLAAEKLASHAKAAWRSEAFLKAIVEVYDMPATRTKALKDAILSVVKERSTKLLDESRGYDGFHVLLRTMPHFGADVAIALALREPSVWYKCPTCNNTFAVAEPGNINFRCPFNCNTADPAWWSAHRA